jgi:peptidoglycan/xylan/chitin deacetylase (PgdA/CDA1 family)
MVNVAGKRNRLSQTDVPRYNRVVMTGGLNFGGKRELLARGMYWSGASFLLSQLPARDSLLVLNYHRIGNPDDDLFDPGVFSATADQFNDQISYLKSRASLVTLEEALAFIDGTSREKTRRCRVLITFDDGYLDNYKIAFPILRSQGAQGVFFLATSMVGTCQVPWWDHIAYLVKTARRRQFTLRYPADLAVDIEMSGMDASLQNILKLYKQPNNSDPVRFLLELAEESKGEEPPGTLRRFLNWDEAREMSRDGMAIGSHTRSHSVLSQLKPDRQLEELSQSRTILKEQLGVEADVLAYPVGRKVSFTGQTQMLVRDAGYRAAFSSYGGANMQGKTSPYNVKRTKMVGQSWSRFRVQTAVCRFTGSYWP